MKSSKLKKRPLKNFDVKQKRKGFVPNWKLKKGKKKDDMKKNEGE